MKLVTNTVPLITNNMYPIQGDDGKVNWSNIETADIGTIFKVKAVTQNIVYLENCKNSLSVDVNLFKEFFVEHEVEV
jgi:hypothetical protein